MDDTFNVHEVTTYIYTKCDPDGTNSVPASVLLEFVGRFFADNLTEFEQLRSILDKNKCNPNVSFNIFLESVKQWTDRMIDLKNDEITSRISTEENDLIHSTPKASGYHNLLKNCSSYTNQLTSIGNSELNESGNQQKEEIAAIAETSTDFENSNIDLSLSLDDDEKLKLKLSPPSRRLSSNIIYEKYNTELKPTKELVAMCTTSSENLENKIDKIDSILESIENDHRNFSKKKLYKLEEDMETSMESKHTINIMTNVENVELTQDNKRTKIVSPASHKEADMNKQFKQVSEHKVFLDGSINNFGNMENLIQLNSPQLVLQATRKNIKSSYTFDEKFISNPTTMSKQPHKESSAESREHILDETLPAEAKNIVMPSPFRFHESNKDVNVNVLLPQKSMKEIVLEHLSPPKNNAVVNGREDVNVYKMSNASKISYLPMETESKIKHQSYSSIIFQNVQASPNQEDATDAQNISSSKETFVDLRRPHNSVEDLLIEHLSPTKTNVVLNEEEDVNVTQTSNASNKLFDPTITPASNIDSHTSISLCQNIQVPKIQKDTAEIDKATMFSSLNYEQQNQLQLLGIDEHSPTSPNINEILLKDASEPLNRIRNKGMQNLEYICDKLRTANNFYKKKSSKYCKLFERRKFDLNEDFLDTKRKIENHLIDIIDNVMHFKNDFDVSSENTWEQQTLERSCENNKAIDENISANSIDQKINALIYKLEAIKNNYKTDMETMLTQLKKIMLEVSVVDLTHSRLGKLNEINNSAIAQLKVEKNRLMEGRLLKMNNSSKGNEFFPVVIENSTRNFAKQLEVLADQTIEEVRCKIEELDESNVAASFMKEINMSKGPYQNTSTKYFDRDISENVNEKPDSGTSNLSEFYLLRNIKNKVQTSCPRPKKDRFYTITVFLWTFLFSLMLLLVILSTILNQCPELKEQDESHPNWFWNHLVMVSKKSTIPI